MYRWPGHLAFPEKPKYYEECNHTNAQNFTKAFEAINETFEHLKNDSNVSLIASNAFVKF